MSSMKCARCEKTVYPIEELKCLDKSWHKGCFKCQECGMTLNMKTYKGYNRQPYCAAHCPVAKHTTVADTPEARRLAENTRIQSQVKYHEDFEKSKGKLTQVADDPETMRIKNTSKIISNALYHGDYEKKKKMEEKRLGTDESPIPIHAANGVSNGQGPIAQQQQQHYVQINSNHNSSIQMPHGPSVVQQNSQMIAKHASNEMTGNNHNPQQQLYQQKPMPVQQQAMVINNHHVGQPAHMAPYHPQQHIQQQGQVHPQMVHQINMNHNPALKASNGLPNMVLGPVSQPQMMPHNLYPQSQHITNHHQMNSNTNVLQMNKQQPALIQQQQQQHPPQQWANPYPAKPQQHQTLVYTSQHGPVHQMPNRNVGSIADYDPHVNDNFGSGNTSHHPSQQQTMYYASGVNQNVNINNAMKAQPQQQRPPQQAQMMGIPHAGDGLAVRRSGGLAVRAMYDYAAQDTDEVSFHDGDLIINCMPIDDGWMTGTVQRTGQTGMLPANYVESVN